MLFIVLFNSAENFFLEECLGGFGAYRIKLVVYGNANPFLASSHAESSAEIHFIFKVVLGDEKLKLFNYLSRAFYMARASDTYCYFNHFLFPPIIGVNRLIGGFLRCDRKPLFINLDKILLIIDDVDPGKEEFSLGGFALD